MLFLCHFQLAIFCAQSATPIWSVYPLLHDAQQSLRSRQSSALNPADKVADYGSVDNVICAYFNTFAQVLNLALGGYPTMLAGVFQRLPST